MIKKIKDIKENDYVLSINNNGELEYKKVKAKMNNGIRKVYKYVTENNNFILCTDNHRVLQFEDNKMFYEEIGKVDYLVSFKDNKLIKNKITSRDIYDESNVIDIEVEDNHNFMTKGEYIVHNSRAGAQVPFSSVNFGTDTTPEGRLVIEQYLLATEAGLGNGETAIFPISVFKVKEGINYNPGDPNYDLFKLSFRVSAKRLFPNYVFIDAPHNITYYDPERPETEAVTMGCRTRSMSSVFPESDGVTFGRGNISFTSINLPRLGIKHGIVKGNKQADLKGFYKELDDLINLVINQLLDRYNLQKNKKVKNFPFLMGQGVWFDSDKLNPEDTLEEVLKHGTLTCGFIGLAETLIALTGKHHGENTKSQELGLEIITHMRKRMDEATKKYNLNFSLIATPKQMWEVI